MRTEIVTTLKRQATRILSELHETKEIVLITEHGRPSAYIVDADAYEMMQERMRILEGIAGGERAVFENQVLSHEGAKRKMEKWLS